MLKPTTWVVENRRMAPSTNAAKLLRKSCPRTGGPANPAALRRALGWSEEGLHPPLRSCAESVWRNDAADASLVSFRPPASRPRRRPSSRPCPLTAQLWAVCACGLLLELDNETYVRAKEQLRQTGLIAWTEVPGTVARSTAKTESAGRTATRLVARERDLYEPFLEWLRSSLADESGFAEAKRTDGPQGYRPGGGRWSRPDVTAVRVTTYELLPGASVEGPPTRSNASAMRRSFKASTKPPLTVAGDIGSAWSWNSTPKPVPCRTPSSTRSGASGWAFT